MSSQHKANGTDICPLAVTLNQATVFNSGFLIRGGTNGNVKTYYWLISSTKSAPLRIASILTLHESSFNYHQLKCNHTNAFIPGFREKRKLLCQIELCHLQGNESSFNSNNKTIVVCRPPGTVPGILTIIHLSSSQYHRTIHDMMPPLRVTRIVALMHVHRYSFPRFKF